MILVEFEDGRGISSDTVTIFINPELVAGIQPDRNGTTTVFTKAYVWLVKGDIKEVAGKLMMPEMLDRAGIPLEDIDKLEKLIEEKFSADAPKKQM